MKDDIYLCKDESICNVFSEFGISLQSEGGELLYYIIANNNYADAVREGIPKLYMQASEHFLVSERSVKRRLAQLVCTVWNSSKSDNVKRVFVHCSDERLPTVNEFICTVFALTMDYASREIIG